MIEVAKRLSSVKGARYMFAATFGNVHGVYKPGNVKLTPVILKNQFHQLIQNNFQSIIIMKLKRIPPVPLYHHYTGKLYLKRI